MTEGSHRRTVQQLCMSPPFTCQTNDFQPVRIALIGACQSRSFLGSFGGSRASLQYLYCAGLTARGIANIS